MIVDQNGIYITKKQASIATASTILICLCVFIAGYFWGKQSVIDEYTKKTSQDSFNDQVDYLLTMQSFAAKHGTLDDESENSDDENAEKLLTGIPDASEEGGKGEEVIKPNIKTTEIASEKKQVAANASIASQEVKEGKHYAAIAGFGKKASALTMVNRLKKYKIDVDVKTKTSKSANGKSIKTWYQVVTKTYGTKQEVAQLVDRIVSLEHVKRNDVKIY